MSVPRPSPDPQPSLPLSVGAGLSLAEVWQGLHAGERLWRSRDPALGEMDHAAMIEGSLRQLAEGLSAVPVERWFWLGQGIGWTAVAASALSWCRDASLGDVVHLWRALDAMPAPESGADYAACLINPALLPDNRLSALVAAGGDVVGLAALIAARSEAPAMDLAPEQAGRLHPAIQAMLKVRQAGVEEADRAKA